MTLRSHSSNLLLCLFSLSAGTTKAWTFPTTTSSQRRPAKRVAIIGTGIAGVSVAHALTNSPLLEEEYGSFQFEVTMFEARAKLETKAGAGVQLNGGLAALGKINGRVQRAVRDAGLPISQIKSRSKPWSNSKTKPFEELLQLDLPDIVKKAGGEVSQTLIQDGELLWYAITRGCLQETLWKTLPSVIRRRVQFNKALSGITPQSDGSVMCEFSDGTTAGPFDVVVGADGVKSKCKEYLETGKVSAEPSNQRDKSAALYSGIRIKCAVDDEWTPPRDEGETQSVSLIQYFGDGANALDGTYGNGAGRPISKIAFFVFLDKDYIGPFRRKKVEGDESSTKAAVDENVNWREVERRNRELTRTAMTAGFQQFSIPSMNIDPIVKTADRFFEVGVYFHNPFSLTGWSKKVAGGDSAVVALCGDAAHTIPPFLGQGANQAIQDAYCLVSKLYQYNANIAQDSASPGLDELLKDYERTRWLHNFIILVNTCFLGYLETGGENGTYAKFRDLFFKTTGLIGVAQRVLLSAAVLKV